MSEGLNPQVVLSGELTAWAVGPSVNLIGHFHRRLLCAVLTRGLHPKAALGQIVPLGSR